MQNTMLTMMLTKKIPDFLEFIKGDMPWLFYETDGSVFSLSLAIKNTDGHTMTVTYCFQEEIVVGRPAHFVCSGKMILRNKKIISSTVIDKYNDCFEPDIYTVLNTFFENVECDHIKNWTIFICAAFKSIIPVIL